MIQSKSSYEVRNFRVAEILLIHHHTEPISPPLQLQTNFAAWTLNFSSIACFPCIVIGTFNLMWQSQKTRDDTGGAKTQDDTRCRFLGISRNQCLSACLSYSSHCDHDVSAKRPAQKLLQHWHRKAWLFLIEILRRADEYPDFMSFLCRTQH